MSAETLNKQAVLAAIKGVGSQLRAMGVCSIGLFGSFQREQAGPASDVDLLVEFDPPVKTYDNFIETCFVLEDLLGRKVELVTRESLSPYLSGHIMKDVEYVTLGT